MRGKRIAFNDFFSTVKSFKNLWCKKGVTFVMCNLNPSHNNNNNNNKSKSFLKRFTKYKNHQTL